MGTEYFSTLAEALDVFTNEQRARDFQEFVIAISFCKRFDPSNFSGDDEVLRAITDFQTFLKPIKALSVDGQTHALIREKAIVLSGLLDVSERPLTLKECYHKSVQIKSTQWTEDQGISFKIGFVVEIYGGKLQVQFNGIHGIFELDVEDVELQTK